jgi:hypothetical protein
MFLIPVNLFFTVKITLTHFVYRDIDPYNLLFFYNSPTLSLNKMEIFDKVKNAETVPCVGRPFHLNGGVCENL